MQDEQGIFRKVAKVEGGVAYGTDDKKIGKVGIRPMIRQTELVTIEQGNGDRFRARVSGFKGATLHLHVLPEGLLKPSTDVQETIKVIEDQDHLVVSKSIEFLQSKSNLYPIELLPQDKSQSLSYGIVYTGPCTDWKPLIFRGASLSGALTRAISSEMDFMTDTSLVEVDGTVVDYPPIATKSLEAITGEKVTLPDSRTNDQAEQFFTRETEGGSNV